MAKSKNAVDVINTEQASIIYKEYEKGREYLSYFNLYTISEEANKYYDSNQWGILKIRGEKPPVTNILKPIVDFKVATVAQQTIRINYTSTNFDKDYKLRNALCDKLNQNAARIWENLKMDSVLWRVVADGAKVGSSFAYLYTDKNNKPKIKIIDSVNVMLADEQEDDLQEQKYIIIVGRTLVSKLRAEAIANGINEETAMCIAPDDEVNYQIGDQAKLEIEQGDGNDGKCLYFIKFYKDAEGYVHIIKSTQTVVYEPDRVLKNVKVTDKGEKDISGAKLYPISQFTWDFAKGSVRGVGEIYHRIPNQIEINKGRYRNLAIVKQMAFPHLVVDETKISPKEVKKLSTVGSTIFVGSIRNNQGQQIPIDDIKKVIGYLNPPQINNATLEAVKDLQENTRDLANAGEAVTGNVNPENASGAAIMAVKDAAALPLNNQTANFRQFVEDIALILFDMLITYNPTGVPLIFKEIDEQSGEEIEKVEIVSSKELQELKIDVRIDISPSNPMSKLAIGQALEKLLFTPIPPLTPINFKQYVKALPDDSYSPKEILLEIVEEIEAREKAEMVASRMIAREQSQQADMEMENLQAQQGQQVQQQQQATQEENENGQIAQANAIIEQLMQENAQLQQALKVKGGDKK